MEGLVFFLLQSLQASLVTRLGTKLMIVTQSEGQFDDGEIPTALFLPSPIDNAPGCQNGFGSQGYDFSGDSLSDLDYVDSLLDTPGLTTSTTASSVSHFDGNTKLNKVSKTTNSYNFKPIDSEYTVEDVFDELEAFLNSSSVEIV